MELVLIMVQGCQVRFGVIVASGYDSAAEVVGSAAAGSPTGF
jgi:hypothetical protein